jgi:hypothetical protein
MVSCAYLQSPLRRPASPMSNFSGGNIVLQASGGIPYDPCFLLTTTNLAAPVQWGYSTTNNFDSG